MDRQIRAMLNHQISYEPFIRYDGRGRPEFEKPLTAACYITSDVKMVRNMDGEEVVSSLTIYLSGTDSEYIGLVTLPQQGFPGTVAQQAHMGRITLPNGRQPPILNVLPYYDYKGSLNYVAVNV